MKFEKKHIISAAIVAFVIFNIVLLISVFSMSGKIKSIENNYSATLFEKDQIVSEQVAQISQLQAYVNQVRTVVGLPPIHFNAEDEEIKNSNAETDASYEEPFDDTVFYDAIPRLVDFYKSKNLAAEFTPVLENIENDLLKTYSKISVNRLDNLTAEIDYASNFVATINFHQNNVVSLNSEDTKLTVSELIAAVSPLINSVRDEQENLEKASNQITLLTTDNEIADILDERFLRFEGSGNNLQLVKRDGSIVLDISYLQAEKKIYIADRALTIDADIKAEFIKEIKRHDLRTPDEILIDENRLGFLDLLDDEAFQAALRQYDLSISGEIREDSDYYYFDTYQGDTLIGSFGIQKWTGEFYLLDNEDIPISNIRLFSDQESVAAYDISYLDNIDISGEAKGEAILLCGSHENNADTIVLVTFDDKEESMDLISIPRDLYYKGRKINSVFQKYGPAVFAQELSEITGYNIEYYMVVDMFAFIDVINILDGIDVTLQADLIDPTYKTFENGEWSTLYYPKGTYTLNGIEALRVARSRHSTSDFSRSYRQQMIIMAIKDKLLDLGVSDIGKVVELLTKMSQYVETNIPVTQMLALYREAGDYSIDEQAVISVHNILYWTWSNWLNLEDESLKDDPNFNKGLWILLPKNDDWSIIPRYLTSLGSN